MFRKDSSTQTIFCLHDLRDITDSDRDYAKTFQGRCYKTFLFIKETTDGKIHFCRLYYLLEFAEAPNFQTFSRRDRRKQKIARHPPTDIPACSISTEPARICYAWLCVTACVIQDSYISRDANALYLSKLSLRGSVRQYRLPVTTFISTQLFIKSKCKSVNNCLLSSQCDFKFPI